MDTKQALHLAKTRLNAQISPKNWHTYPLAEEALHTLEITQATVDTNFICSVSRSGSACWCEPDVEDYTDQGGGVLIMHRQVTWN